MLCKNKEKYQQIILYKPININRITKISTQLISRWKKKVFELKDLFDLISFAIIFLGKPFKAIFGLPPRPN